LALLADAGDEAKVLAGGQSLIPVLKTRFAHPEMLVDINGIAELDYHRRDDDGTIRVGALSRHADLERSALVAEHQPTMAAAAPVIADPLVRNRGTLVGSLCHADPQGDWAAVMAALDATVVAAGPRGRRTIPVADFVTGPFQNALGHDELAVEAAVPAPRGVASGGYLKLERRVGDFATVGVAVAVDRTGATVARAGIALTGVGGSTISADEAARALVGGPLTAEAIDEAAEKAAQAAQPRSDHRGSADYKRHLVRVFTRRILGGLIRSGEEAA
jgi:aerobic carbon-monoxide dehydrogenase medium subunit